jgi:hypothetical protein
LTLGFDDDVHLWNLPRTWALVFHNTSCIFWYFLFLYLGSNDSHLQSIEQFSKDNLRTCWSVRTRPTPRQEQTQELHGCLILVIISFLCCSCVTESVMCDISEGAICRQWTRETKVVLPHLPESQFQKQTTPEVFFFYTVTFFFIFVIFWSILCCLNIW